MRRVRPVARSVSVESSRQIGLGGVRCGGGAAVRNGKVATTDGPFAETKEQLGGYYIIEVPHIDEAIKWASRIPSAANGSIEVRPLVAGPPDQ
ncbi:MAG: hypothetical protein IPI73_19175 [Betaproteobacteria bacterium]|nr:hypothetical protein [Betaproteobacteria bacterium]